MHTTMRWAGLAAGVLAWAAAARADDYVWIEGEAPTTVPALAPLPDKPDDKGYAVSGWGNAHFMSGGKVLSLSLSPKDAAARLPKEGAVFGYAFEVRAPGAYEVWARIGYEWVRSDFDWRIDEGAWQTLRADEPTSDVMPIQVWNELAWIRLGRQDLSAGKHVLQVRHVLQMAARPAAKKPDGAKAKAQVAPPAADSPPPALEPARTLHLTDCFCLYRGAFRPNSKFKPDEDYRTPQDREAADHVYEMPEPAGAGERVAADLSGPWQIARWDEQVVREEDRLQGTDALPPDLDRLAWYGLRAPGSRDALRPDLAFSHRYLYRARVRVPAALAGRAFFLNFQNFNMIATVFVNGVRCGWSRAHSTEWDCDVTRALRPGAVNDLVVVFKDAYYAIRDLDSPHGTRRYWNLPHDWLHNQGTSMKMDMPVVWDTRTGLLEPVTLVAAGRAYTADVFAKPSVRRKELGLEVAVRNPGRDDVTVRVETEVVPWNGGQGGPAEMTFAARDLAVPAGQERVLALAEPWAGPRLWWPDDPHLYWAVTRLSVGGQVVDVVRTRLGFREWTWDGPQFRLNGVAWPMWADCDYGPTPQAWVEKAKTSGMNMVRYWRRDGWGGMTRRQVLDFLDEHGVPVRASGVFDGEHAAYGLAERAGGEKRPNRALFDNWTNQMQAWVRAERNHPAIFVWSIENEIVYINAQNLGNWDVTEPEVRRAAEAVMAWDPTRPVMVDGGRALRDGSLPVNGCHYNEESGVALRDYPDAAYTTEHWFRVPHRGAWPMAPGKPIFHGECFYANGWTPARFATLGGDRCFVGMSETREACGLFARMLSEGWRWAGVAAWHFWFGEADRSYYAAWQPVAVFCRQWNWTFAGGSEVPRTLKVFNSTRHADPIEATWHLAVGGRTVAGEKKTFALPPGEAQEWPVTVRLPAVKDRTAGEFVLTATRGGKEVFRDTKAVRLIDPDAAPRPALAAGDLVVLDPRGTVKARLASRGIAFTEAASVEAVPAGARCLVVGPDAVPEDRAADPAWLRLAAAGTRMLVLDQAHPLRYQAVPADLEVTPHTGRIAFAEDLGHPAFAGLDPGDLFTWSGDHVVYRRAYDKPARGGRSLVQCDFELGCTALVECPAGDGLMLLCQMAVGEKLATDPVARRLFDNLLNYVASYVPVRKATSVVMDGASPRGRLLAGLGLRYDEAPGPLAALGPAYGIAVLDATPAHLRALAGAPDRVRAFTDRGGWIVLWGLTPEGLADFNRLVGVEHLLRPFQLERVLLASPRDPLTAGLTLRDVVLEDSEKIFGWMGLRWAADDAFTYIVDHTDIAPFARMPTPEEMGKGPDRRAPRSDHWPPNMVNGFTADDSWRYCYSILLDDGHKTKWTLNLPREEELTNFSIVLNTIYHKVTKIRLYFDDDPTPAVLETRPTHDRQDFPVAGRKARRLTLELAEWQESGRSNVIGIDNLWLGVKRSEAFLAGVRPLLNIGGLVRYPRGPGGFLLNQLHILPAEKLPLNAEKKATITKVLLQNLGAVFQGGRTVVVGADLRFDPVPLGEGTYNAYLTRRGQPPWFPHKGDLGALPAGRGKFAGVPYQVLDFMTSPVPSCVMLAGAGSQAAAKEVRGIRVGRRADALFFLHACHAQRGTLAWTPADRRGREVQPPEVFRYVIHYKDSRTADVPVVWKRGVAHWVDKDPRPLMQAAVAWTAPLPGDAGDKAVLYSMQWNNPRPDVEIESVDLVYGDDGDKWGTPALVALTAATAAK